mgnify:CR=1 FL=1
MLPTAPAAAAPTRGSHSVLAVSCRGPDAAGAAATLRTGARRHQLPPRREVKVAFHQKSAGIADAGRPSESSLAEI